MNKVLVIIMDGVGVKSTRFGNAVAVSKTPNLDFLEKHALYTTLYAHGKSVGLPSDSDIGNSEVGHNTLGGGRIFVQGAKLVQEAIRTRSLFEGEVWRTVIGNVKTHASCLHFIGLLSDGNVHAHEQHLYALLEAANKEGVKKIRVHALLDGRDVSEKSAEVYAVHLDEVIKKVRAAGCDVEVASGGGRMVVTMDRYEADWRIVERGWHAHVLGDAPHKFSSLLEAIRFFRKDESLGDQYFPPFVITKDNQPVGLINDNDSVVFFNFRGDRAIEICRAFTETSFKYFDRQRVPKTYFAGMMQYDGDALIPKNYLVAPPAIADTLSEYLCNLKVRQFACSETQKFGHVTYFWNGNRSGMIDSSLEDYLEIPSDRIAFDLRPQMKAEEIASATMERMREQSFTFGRINFANGDMVGHTGNFRAAIQAMETVDAQIGRLVDCARKEKFQLIITADHGNCDEMFEGKENDYPNWETCAGADCPPPKTSHSLSPVPLYILLTDEKLRFKLVKREPQTLANIANTALALMGVPQKTNYFPSLVEKV